MGKKYQLVRTASMSRRFTCGECEAQADVVLTARGESGWQREGLFDPDPSGKWMMESATLDLASDAGAILSLVRCPVCGHRSRLGVTRSVLRYLPMLGASIIVSGILAVAAPDGYHLLVGCLLFPLCALISTLEERRRWREAKRCVEGVRPTAPLPKAVAKVPAPRPAAPIVPLASRAPEQIERASDEAGPSFLR